MIQVKILDKRVFFLFTRKLALALPVLFFWTAPLFAQGAPQGNYFNQKTEKYIKSQTDSADLSNLHRKKAQHGSSSFFSFPEARDNFWLKDPNAIREEDNSGQILENIGYLEQSYASYGPLSGFADITHSKVYTDQFSRALSSPLTASMITLSLTEPAVFAGAMGAGSYAQAALQSRYLAENQLQNEFMLNPQASEIFSRAYHECIAKFMRGEYIPGQPNKATSWVEAQHHCMRDTGFSRQESGAGLARNFEEDSLDGTGFGSGFWLGDDRSHPNSVNQNFSQNIYTISLTDYLLEQTKLYAKSGQPGVDPQQLQFLEESIQQLMGNVLFTLDDPHAQQVPGSVGKLTTTVLRPGESSAVWLRLRAEKIYENLFNILIARCLFAASDSTSNQQPGYQKDSGFYDTHFISFVKNYPIVFAMQGYQITARNIETLYLLFADAYQIVKPDKAACVTTLNASPGGASSIKNLIQNPNLRKNFHEIAFSAARLLALGQIFNTLQYAQRAILSLSSGSYMQNFILKYAQGLLWNVMGTDKFLEAQQEIRNQLTELMRSAEISLAKNVGKSGRSIREGVGSNSGGAKTNTTNPN
ncbi:MAG TPA: hypothetical protein PKD37_03305 [Oligoflexia bacterium]|nr:hypothetical protein [Oligoflexia bacterium]HMP26996.1 hypothetical protein [Oligoflexia bacterium]